VVKSAPTNLRQVIPAGFYLGNIIPGAGHLSGGSLADDKRGPGHVAKRGTPRQKAAGDDLFTNAAVALRIKDMSDAEKAEWDNGSVSPSAKTAVYDSAAGEAARLEQIIVDDFNSITPENQAKWESVAPNRGSFYFDELDEIVDFAEAHGQRVRGHALLWHNQNPDWLLDLFEPGAATDAELRHILEEHIAQVVGRYAGRIAQWDVANEILDDDGNWRVGNPWIDRFGPSVVVDAFRLAHQADPTCELFLNDYNVEGINPKSDGFYAICQQYLADGVPLHGFGIQGHLGMQYEYPNDIRDNVARFAALGLKVEFTEVDIRLIVSYRYNMEKPENELEQQGEAYARLVREALSVPGCTGITIWGVSDNYSWIPSLFKGEGAPTLFDDNLDPKPAYYAVHRALAENL
jgi:endo-1,4-beta-xylanase